jgi:hypothetical protein
MNNNKILEYLDEILEKIKRPVYLWFAFLPFIAYIISMFGLIYLNPAYVELIKSLTQIVIAVILIIRFNPMKEKHQLKDYDETIIFGTALILITNASLTNNFVNYLRTNV